MKVFQAHLPEMQESELHRSFQGCVPTLWRCWALRVVEGFGSSGQGMGIKGLGLGIF